MNQFILLIILVISSRLVGAVYLDINTQDQVSLSNFKVSGDCHKVCDFFCSNLGSSSLLPSVKISIDEVDELILRVDGVEIPFPDELKSRLVLFLKQDLEGKDCSKFCSYVHGFSSNIEEEDCFDMKRIRDIDKLSLFNSGDVVSIGVTSGEEYSSRHYALYLHKNLFISKFGSYPGLGVTTFLSLINLYTSPGENLRLFRFTRI